MPTRDPTSLIQCRAVSLTSALEPLKRHRGDPRMFKTVRALGTRGGLVKAELPKRRTVVWRQSGLAPPRPPRSIDQRGFLDRPCPLALAPGSLRYGVACFDRSWPTIATAANHSRRRSIPRSDGGSADRPLRSTRSVVHRHRDAGASYEIRSLGIVPILHTGRSPAVSGR
jgi:hypothetical protein